MILMQEDGRLHWPSLEERLNIVGNKVILCVLIVKICRSNDNDDDVNVLKNVRRIMRGGGCQTRA